MATFSRLVTMPNFLIIGAQMAGITSTYRYLGEHPEVYMSPMKGTRFFACEGLKIGYFRGPEDEEVMSRGTITDLGEYQAHFAGFSGERAVGEASPIYLYSPRAAGRIRHYIPDAKLIALLRNPVDRAYSAYLLMVGYGRERLGFRDALEAEAGRIEDRWHPIWHYRNRGFYHPQLGRYYELFGQDQLRVYLYEDLSADPLGTMQSIFGFLGVDETFMPDTSRWHERSGFPRNRALHAFFERPNPLKRILKPFLPEKLRNRISANLRNHTLTDPPPLPEDAREELTESYRDDVLRLQRLIGRDLSGWLRKEA
ncbi:MAG: sulfotransferase family protein [Solirubrobacterales bacterium]